MKDKKYWALLAALAEFVKRGGTAVTGLDDFLAGYAGQDWQQAKGWVGGKDG